MFSNNHHHILMIHTIIRLVEKNLLIHLKSAGFSFFLMDMI